VTTIERGGGRTLAAEATGDGPPLVLVHEGIADMRMWDDVVPALAERHRVLRYDLPGYGRSPLGSEPISSTADLDAVLDAFDVPRAALVGGSLGGRVALEYALARPERVSALLLVAPGVRGHEWSSVARQGLEEEDEAFERGDYPAAADAMVRLWAIGPRRTAPDVDPAVLERVREMSVRSYELLGEALAAGHDPAEADVPDPPAVERLGEIRVPTLLLVGDEDVPDMLQIADRLVAGIPSARKVVWEGVAHMPPMERPGEFAGLVLDFLASSSAAA
jgi:pimeloyl-ACP methyl ester carboxylesterase